ncbi:MAG: YrdB family protein [Acidimicrobiia bacterium]|nr:YrdB family protein [Acidimicrobiia bacterium]
MSPEVAPPTMAGWNLALRFGLELVALFGLGFAAWKLTSGPVRPAAVVILPVFAATLWTVFNVVGDPSRSGAAPVEVPGWTRLVIELAVLGAGAVAIFLAGRQDLGLAHGAVIIFHYAVSWPRVQWLLGI